VKLLNRTPLPDLPSTLTPNGLGDSDEPVTLTVARRVAPGREQEFEDWARGVLAAAARFPGYLGGGVLRPGTAGRQWHLVYRFADFADQARWQSSDERRAWLDQVDELAEDTRVHRVSGLETWFELPGHTAPAPPRWKMAIATWSAVVPLSVLFALVVAPPLAGLPDVVRILALPTIFVPTMTWLVMPRVTRALRRWLYPAA
jgi:antibiotic biosynthesis monooxygenase (ABM) superfamily enzyme